MKLKLHENGSITNDGMLVIRLAYGDQDLREYLLSCTEAFFAPTTYDSPQIEAIDEDMDNARAEMCVAMETAQEGKPDQANMWLRSAKKQFDRSAAAVEELLGLGNGALPPPPPCDDCAAPAVWVGGAYRYCNRHLTERLRATKESRG